MSVIYPRTYRLISEQLGEAYGKVRDAIFLDGANYLDSALGNSEAIVDLQSGDADNNFDGSNPPDKPTPTWTIRPFSDILPSSEGFSDWYESDNLTAPEGSIAKDLGAGLFTLTNTTLTAASSRSNASRLFAPYLRALNSHVINRTYGISTIGGYYQQYAFIGDVGAPLDYQDNLNLFDDDPLDSGLGTFPSYFSPNFVELSAQIGVTIDEAFQGT